VAPLLKNPKAGVATPTLANFIEIARLKSIKSGDEMISVKIEMSTIWTRDQNCFNFLDAVGKRVGNAIVFGGIVRLVCCFDATVAVAKT
jgi:hypothetical protein